MKIWYEALTGKQSLLFHHIALYYEKLNHTSIFTTRNNDYTELNLLKLKRKFHSIGKYGGSNLKNKLIEGTNRIQNLANLIDKEKPDLLISFSSPDAVRTAYGLGIPVLLINDTPHAEAVARLTLSLSKGLIHSSSIKSEKFGKFGVTKFYPYNGVDESLWIRNFEYNSDTLTELNLKPNQFIVLRTEESQSAYYQKLFPKMSEHGTYLEYIIQQYHKHHPNDKIVVFPRYPEQYKILNNYDVIIPSQSVDTLSLLYKAKGLMTGGGTMARESAMLGTPTIYTFPMKLAVSEYLSKLNFPIYHEPNYKDAFSLFLKIIANPKIAEQIRQEKLNNIETPVNAINKALSDLGF